MRSEVVARELVDSAPVVDTISTFVTGQLLVSLRPDTGIVIFAPDSATLRSVGRTRFPRRQVGREMPRFQLVLAGAATTGSFVDSAVCVESRGDQLVSGLLPLPLLLPRSTFDQAWTDSTRADVCLGALPLRLLIVTRYAARPVSEGGVVRGILVTRQSTLESTSAATMDSVPVEIRLTGRSSGEGTLTIGPDPTDAVIFTDSVSVDVSFRSPYREQRFEQRGQRVTRLMRQSAPARVPQR